MARTKKRTGLGDVRPRHQRSKADVRSDDEVGLEAHEATAKKLAPGPANALIVGIGASAGGIEALKEFFKAMPSDSGMAFVVIQHLEPTYESRMADILANYTRMKVVQAGDGMPMEANNVYTNPAGTYLSIHHGRLVLSGPLERGHIRMPIDLFFSSLAEDLDERAVGIILSGGSGSDGTQGIRNIRSAGGMCMVQEPQTAQFAAMPQSAIDTGLVDYVLPVDQMPAALLAYARHLQVPATGRVDVRAAAACEDLESILKLLLIRTHGDYRHYKRTMVVRRLHRRMGLKQIGSLADYLKLLQEDQGELDQLSRDMLIGVSSFFRDGEAFEELRKEAIVPLVEKRGIDSPLRAWVPGCATGEEAYSVAILLLEATAAWKSCPVQVFASDVDDHALDVGRAGAYPESIAEDVSSDRLKRFFTKQGQTYQVNKELREAVAFSRQNLITDPPFSKLDLISCRNVLIYLEPAVQKKIFSLFSFALNVSGHLFLGKSESAAGMGNLFEPVSKRHRVYCLIRANRQAAGAFPLHMGGRRAGLAEQGRAQPPPAGLVQASQEVILRHFNAAIVLIDPEGQILHFHGETERYLSHPTGLASLNVLDMTAGMLGVKLRRAIEKALQQDEAVAIPQVPLPREGSLRANLTVMRVPSVPGADKLLAVVFEDAREPQPTASTSPVSAEDESLVAQLEAEAKALRNKLHANAEEYDSASEELKAANEEAMSFNEELQSANEELDASKEELQSVNEELTTVNSQLNEKLAELTAANNDLANLLGATEIATVFLDSELRIRRFTPGATRLLNLIPTDLGRPISHITQNFDGKDLASDAARMLENLSAVEKEVQTRDGHWHTMRILPYRTLDDRIDGVVITFSDVTRLKQVEDRLEYEKTCAENIIDTVREPIVVLDVDLRVISANRPFYQTFHVTPEATQGRLLYDLGNQQWDIPALRKLIEEILPKNESMENFEVEHEFQAIGQRIMLLNARQIYRKANKTGLILLAIEDITHRRQAEKELEKRNIELEQSNKELDDFTHIVSHDLREPLRGIRDYASRLMESDRTKLDATAGVQIGALTNLSNRLDKLITSLLRYSQVGRMELAIKKTNINHLLAEVMGSLRTDQEYLGVEIRIPKHLPTIMCDRIHVGEIFRNLISNAIKYNDKTQKWIEVGYIEDSDLEPGSPILGTTETKVYPVIFYVRDNGIGIRPQHFESVFHIFNRLHGREQFGGGTGAGLTIAKKIIERHGGQIWLESTYGEGTTFYFALSGSQQDHD